MKLLFPPRSFCRLIAWSALAPVASFAANVGGNPSFYDTDNWYGYRSNSNIQFSSTEASIQFTQLDKSFDNVCGDVSTSSDKLKT